MPLDPTDALIGDWSTDNNANEPDGGDLRKQGDDQIRGAKGTIRRHFPNFVGTAAVPKKVLASEDDLNVLAGRINPVVTLPVGAIMYFEAPVTPGEGWVKKTDPAYDDVALRVVTGTPGSGGSLDFSTVFTIKPTEDHTLTGAESGTSSHTHPAHVHDALKTTGAPGLYQTFTILDAQFGATYENGAGGLTLLEGTVTPAANAADAASPHAHDMNIDVGYRDVYAAEFTGY